MSLFEFRFVIPVQAFKRLVFFLVLVLNLLIPVARAQQWKNEIKDPDNFFSIRQAYFDYRAKTGTEDKEADGEETKFRRWEYFMEPRVYPSGKLPERDILWKELKKYNASHAGNKSASAVANWTPLESPAGFPPNGYAGRANCIAFHPQDSNIMFLGMPAGGLWKTTDGGLSWMPLTDNLPSLGVSEIAIHPLNPDTMYMASGDKDGAAFISNPYSYGLLKSTDGGITWDTTGLQFIFDDQMTIQRLLIHPVYPNILFAAVTGVNGNYRGIWKSMDDGITWTNVYGGAKYDIELNPANPFIMYATAYTYVIKSADLGSTWSVINSPVLPTSGVTSSKIAVTPAQPNIIYLQYLNPNTGGTYGLYKSSDAGTTWVQKNSFALSTQGGYDWVLAVSPSDSNLVIYGGQSIYKSTDGGTNSTFFFAGHVDHHGLEYRPGSNTLFNCNDGGIYKTYDNGMNWINLNHTLQTFQYYRLGCSVTDPGFILTGAQDNGTWKHNYPNWTLIGWGDGMECLVDYSDTSIYYISSQYGNISRFGSGLGTFTAPPTAGSNSSCAWVTPYLIHPGNPSVLFFGAKDIYKTINRGNSWTSYSTNLTVNDPVGGGMLRNMAVSESNPDSVMYAVSYVVVYKTTDAGTTWQNITSNLPVSAGCFNCSALSDVVIHPSNPDIAWVTMSGYSAGNRVFKTTDGGANWINISGTLPIIPVNCVVYENNSADALYIGTDIGVFYLDSTLTDWIPYMSGLPNVPVQELEIHYGTGKIRAATFGRGLWESNLSGINTWENSNIAGNAGFIVYPNPGNGIFIVEIPDEYKNYNLEITGIYNNKLFSETLASEKTKVDMSTFAKGLYFCRLISLTGKATPAKKIVIE